MSVPVWGRLSGGRPMARCAIRPAAWGASMLRIRRACGAPMPAGIRRASPWALMMPAVTQIAPRRGACAHLCCVSLESPSSPLRMAIPFCGTGILTGGSNKVGSVHQLWICQHILYSCCESFWVVTKGMRKVGKRFRGVHDLACGRGSASVCAQAHRTRRGRIERLAR